MYNTRFRNRSVASDCFLSRLAPLFKILVLLLTILSTLLVTTWLGLGLVACYAFIMCRLAGMGFRHYIKALSSFTWMLVLAFAINLIFPAAGTAEPFSFSAMLRGLYFSLRLGVVVGCVLGLTETISPSDLPDAMMVLTRMGGRLGAVLRDLATSVSLALRFAPILLDEAEKIRVAQLIRGRRIRGLRPRISFAVDLIVPLIDAAMRRSESLGYALEARGYGVRVPTRTSIRVGKSDIVILSISVGVVVVIVLSQAL